MSVSVGEFNCVADGTAGAGRTGFEACGNDVVYLLCGYERSGSVVYADNIGIRRGAHAVHHGFGAGASALYECDRLCGESGSDGA